MKPLFSICVMGKNEAKTLPKKLLPSIKHFLEAGGEVVYMDTGSIDDSKNIAAEHGCTVHDVGPKFIISWNQLFADQINERFVVEGEQPIVTADSKIYDYASARNHCASLATNDYVLIADCDEVFTHLDIEKCNDLCKRKFKRADIPYIHSHDKFGRPSTQFTRNAFYDRRHCKWSCVVHEILESNCPIEYPDASVLKLEHFQEGSSNRERYLAGLAYDCFHNQDKDRQSHYFARELMYRGRYRSSIKEFERHIAMEKAWKLEQSQSMIYIGDCWLYLGFPDKAVDAWIKSFMMFSKRRDGLMRCAEYFYKKGDHERSCAFANAALAVTVTHAYCNRMDYYTNLPHEILYVGQWWMGRKALSKQHWEKAIEACPNNQKYIDDGKFYETYPGNNIHGWMTQKELEWLCKTAEECRTVLEIGAWKGRSTHALCFGCKGVVTSVDHFLGSEDERSTSHKEAVTSDIFAQFKKNTEELTNLRVMQTSSGVANYKMNGDTFDMIFIDASHKYEDVKMDLQLWKTKATKIICGHDYNPSWPGVVKAVKEEIGEVETCGSIWYKRKE